MNLAINTIFKKDPTRTLTLRKRFVSDMTRRFKKIQKLIYQSIVENDCFGLVPSNVFPFPSSTKIRVMEAARKGQFAFTTTEGKVKSFMSWLREQDDNEILEVTEREGREIVGRRAWQNTYIDSAYKQGILRAQLEMSKIGIPNAKRPLEFAFFRPIHADRVGLIYTRTFESLKTVTQVMEDRAQKILAEGLSTGLARGIAEGKNPLTIARELTRDINREGIQGIGINRARMIARTEIIRAHHVAGINEYREAAVAGVEVQAEWGTAGWNVCSICLSLEGQVFSLDEIEPMIPRHPNCRCVAIPVVPEEVEEEPDYISTDEIKKTFGKDVAIGKDSLGSIMIFSKNEERSSEQYKMLSHLKDEVVSDKAQNLAYTKRGIEQISGGWAGCIQLDKRGKPIGSSSFELIGDSLRVELLGSTERGAGGTVVREMVDQSRNFKRSGAITLTPIQDLNTIQFYDHCGFDSKPGSEYGEFFLSKENSVIFSEEFDAKHGKIGLKSKNISVQESEIISEKRRKVREALEADFSGEVDVLAKSRRPEDE